jgi:bifunctional non-homologous end joining protein LigD
VPIWAQTSQRRVAYPLCEDRRTLLGFANQRAVEFHPTLARLDPDDDGGRAFRQTDLIIDLDPADDRDPEDGFRDAVRAAFLVREALAGAGLEAAVKTSGAKGLHVVVPITGAAAETGGSGPDDGADRSELSHLDLGDVAAATRALTARTERLDPALVTTAFIRDDRGGRVFLDATRSGGATVAAVYSPRARPGLPVSFPLPWGDLDRVSARDFTVHTARGLLGDGDPWRALRPDPQPLPPELVAEGHTIPVARVQAMHEGKRRAKARREAGDE